MRLYLDTWKYNSSRLLTELARIVEKHGGRVKPLEKAVISNRTADGKIRDYEDKLELWNSLLEADGEGREDLRKLVTETKEKLEELEAYREPIEVTHITYIRFVLDGYCYYYQTDDNPFFDFFYSKSPVAGDMYKVHGTSGKDKKEWLHDRFFKFSCTEEDIREGAEIIFNMLINSITNKKIEGRMEKIDW